MAVHETQAALAEKARIHPAAPLRNRGARPFDLHPAVHLMLIGAWLGFVGILCAAFMGPDLVVPAAIFAIGVVALFVTPGLWARVADDGNPRKQSWAEFREEGVDTHTGRLTSGEALAQIMTLPVLVIALALFFVALKASL
ncbi:MAG TPA: hypothetical protein VMG08_05520 [Allosphingosinicella sp.]|nr:hypothetical protein [Allosphingosinicella sp.]